MKIISFIYRASQYLKQKSLNLITQKIAYLLMKINLVELGISFKSRGIPKVFVHRDGKMQVGKKFKINNTIESNSIGRSFRCIFRVKENALLKIGDNVGMSGTAIVCHQEVTISNNVKIGGNTCIYDTDFHSLHALDRIQRDKDIKNTNKKSVFIGENVFIGAHVTILKGVHIGESSIIGACSVVSKNIPANEVWAGNPAKLIRKINDR